MADLKSLIAKLATGATLSQDETHAAFDIMMSGDATPSQAGGFLIGLRVRGETVDEITGAAKAMREKADHRFGAARHHRHLRHRRRRDRHLQCLDGGRSGGRGVRCSGGEARQPRDVVEIGLGRRVDRARRQHRGRSRGGRSGDRRCRHRFSDGAATPRRDAPRRRHASRTRHPDDLQYPRAAVESRPEPSAN